MRVLPDQERFSILFLICSSDDLYQPPADATCVADLCV